MTRILVVDDAAFMRYTIRQIIHRYNPNIEVHEAENNVSAVQMYKDPKTDYDLVTMDLLRPEKKGLEALEEIMEHDPDANILMISADGCKETIRKVIRSGAKTFIVKPIKEDYFTNVLDCLLK